MRATVRQEAKKKKNPEDSIRKYFCLEVPGKLVSILVREYSKFVFDAGTITRSLAVNQPGEKRRVFKAGSKDFVNFLSGMKDEAVHLFTALLN